jgi:hypothetical protein
VTSCSSRVIGAFLGVFTCTLAAHQLTEPAHRTMVVVGCLQRGPEGSTSYRLANASVPGPASGVPGTPGASTAGQRAVGTSAAITEYELTTEGGVDRSPTQSVDLDSYVGRRVEVTARPPEVEPPAPRTSPNAERSDGSKVAERKPPRLIVTALKQLSPSCQ